MEFLEGILASQVQVINLKGETKWIKGKRKAKGQQLLENLAYKTKNAWEKIADKVRFLASAMIIKFSG